MQLPSDYKQTEEREFNPETNSGVKIVGSKTKKKATPKNFRNSAGKQAYMSYPIARTMRENTGDTLRIKCVEYIAMDEGTAGDGSTSVRLKNAVIKLGDGSSVANTAKNREKYQKDSKEKLQKPQFEASFTDANTRVKNNMKTKYNIELPIPQEVNDSNQVTWGDDRVNAIQLAGLAIAKDIIEEGPVDAIQKSQQAIRAMLSGVQLPDIGSETTNAVRAALSGAAVGALGGNITADSVIARSTGQILNSNLELLFQGVNLRTFPYSITFSPRSTDEALVVKAIIRSLKQSMSPKAGNYNGSAQGIFLQSPDLFQLEYLKDGAPHPFLNKFKLAALTGMSVNYTNSGTYSSYDDGTPVNLRMDLTFKEINPIYHEDYLPYNGADAGVGF